MASSLFFRASNLVSSATIRRRIPLLGAFCVLGLGFPSLCSILPSSSYLKTSCPQSPHFVHIERSKFSTQSADKTVQAVKMEGNSNIVPSIVVYVTVPNREAGRKLAGSIVKEKLAACVNIVPGLESVYLWEGKINSDPEEMLIIKTRQSLLEALTEHVKANHEYDVPEVIALPITGGSPQYLEWLKNSTRD
ncbi:protein CutA, chloroplastic-like [Gossypium australe]|uniref:Protein CutA, chloroplastic-like n=1 Tax=Gossypium australe TaxID=47621 RepID=A0A5B6W5Z9_9ROSI|nr:protein CutA, chloroplastic-like [Gossypium australe]